MEIENRQLASTDAAQSFLMGWREILHIRITDSFALGIDIGWLGAVLLLVSGLVIWKLRQRWHQTRSDWHPVEATLALGNIGSVRIVPKHDVVRLAHQAWVEFATRKAGIPFDEDHDVIEEVYNSWYELFRQVRAITKQVPAELLRENEDCRELVKVLVEALNHGLRPHLTAWQARFRSWYRDALEKQPGKAPQEIQKAFPEYERLVVDIKLVNGQLVEYTKFLRKIAQG